MCEGSIRLSSSGNLLDILQKGSVHLNSSTFPTFLFLQMLVTNSSCLQSKMQSGMCDLKGRIQYQLFLAHSKVCFKGKLSRYSLLFISVTNARNSHGSHEEVLPCLSQILQYNAFQTHCPETSKLFSFEKKSRNKVD